MKRLSIDLPDPLYNRLKAITGGFHGSLRHVVVQMLESFCKEAEEKHLDLGSDLLVRVERKP